ncbi:MAG TPA: hypothetical protein VNA69_03585 [Thermoanaerobaculia bacterium]|nr:hypothetical protein [Thermoanaerobaculia bacterium]
MTLTRKLLAKWSGGASRERVYELADSFEIETNEHYEITRRRVYFDDVQLVTIHRERGTLYLVFTGLAAAGFAGLFALIVGFGGIAAVPAASIFGVIALALLIAFLLRAILGVDIVTIFGRRSKALLRFRVRKERAREMYEHVCAVVREAQNVAAGFSPPAETPPTDTPPMPPG